MVEHRRNILVVDDEEFIRKKLDKMLRGAGYNVLAACNTREAENILQANDVDLAILDKNMPDWTELPSNEAGIELLETIRETHPELQVIILTADPSPKTAFDAGHIGAFDYVTKGEMKKKDLLALVEEALRIDAVLPARPQSKPKIHEVEDLAPPNRERWLKKRLSSIADEIIASIVLSVLLFAFGKIVGVLEGGLADWLENAQSSWFLIVGFALVALLISAYVYWQHRS